MVLRVSEEVHPPKNSVSDAGPKSLEVVQAPVKGSQETILNTLRVILGDIDGYEVAKAHSSGCSTHSLRLSDPINEGLLGEKRQKSVM